MKNYNKKKQCSYLTYIENSNLYEYPMNIQFTKMWTWMGSKLTILMKFLSKIMNLVIFYKRIWNIIDNSGQHSFFSEKMVVNKIEKTICNMHDKKDYVVRLKN